MSLGTDTQLEQPVVGADDVFGCGVGDVGDVALDPGQCAGLGLQFTVDALGGVGELDEPVAFDGGLAGHGLLGLADLLVDALEGSAGPVVLVPVVPHLVAAFVAWPGRPDWTNTCPSGISASG